MNGKIEASEQLAAVEHLQTAAEQALARIKAEQELKEWYHLYLSRQGEVTQLLRGIGDMPLAMRREVGRVANQLQRRLISAYEDKTDQLKRMALKATLSASSLDVTLPGRFPVVGRLHPVTQVLREMTSAFRSMGFQVMQGPEVETDEYNFTLLNMPPHHPARDMQDTFYVDVTASGLPPATNWVLRTQTSPNQVRVMQRSRPPLRVVVPGAVYRPDNPDPSHNWMFHQMEGFAIGRGISLADLKGTIEGMIRQLFGPKSRLRFRGTYFPFTEPSVEVDLGCTLCGGKGCRLCGDSGWLEIIPGGMIHPQVLHNGGIDPTQYTGFAFGAGPDRIAALKFGIEDIRYLYQNDMRFLEQF
jgi:phenylalanyl-tRNA synthetase alpha chain